MIFVFYQIVNMKSATGTIKQQLSQSSTEHQPAQLTKGNQPVQQSSRKSAPVGETRQRQPQKRSVGRPSLQSSARLEEKGLPIKKRGHREAFPSSVSSGILWVSSSSD
jgi:hypothetical protein